MAEVYRGCVEPELIHLGRLKSWDLDLNLFYSARPVLSVDSLVVILPEAMHLFFS